MENILGGNADHDLFKDADFMNLLQEMKKTAPSLKKASNMKGKQVESLAEQVAGRCAFAQAGFAMQAICGSPLSAKGFVATRNPPVPTGMMHSVNELKRIVIDEYNEKKATEFHKVICQLFVNTY